MNRNVESQQDSDEPLSPTIHNFRHRPALPPSAQTVSDAMTRFSGSMTFVVIHAVWFGLWIAVNIIVPDSFDPFPFGLLTLVVSLEAIFLSTFVLISQNQQSAKNDRRTFQDFQTNVYSEALCELIGERLGIDDDDIRQRYQDRMNEANSREYEGSVQVQMPMGRQ